MAATTIARKHRRTRKVHGFKKLTKKLTLLGAATATATAMTVGMASPGMTPAANAIDANATTTGPLLWALNAVGLDSISTSVPVLGDVTLNLAYLPSDPVALYDALNAPGFVLNLIPGSRTFNRPATVPQLLTNAIAPLLVADGLGVFGTREAYNALLASANGNTPDGYTPLTNPGLVNTFGNASPCGGLSGQCLQGTNVTNLAIVLVDNPFTPNGGIVARFPFVADFLGVDTTTPTGQSASGAIGVRVNGGVINVALGYNPSADFPASANPFSLANSFTAGLLPTYLLGGFSIEGAGVAAIAGNLVSLLGGVTGLSAPVPFTSYTTLAPFDLPFMEPMRLPSRLFNLISFALGSDLRISTPLADALQPAFEIMVNTGYTDVETPSEGGTYNRTYDKSAVNTPFRTEAPLTLQESLAVPGDVLQALWDGSATALENLFTDGLFYRNDGLLDPAPTAAVPAPTAATLAKVQPLAAAASEVEAPEVEAVSDDITPTRSKARHSQKASPAAAASVSDDNDGPDANAQKSARGGAGSGDSDNSSKRDRSSRRAG